jgi:hypothetical protein
VLLINHNTNTIRTYGELKVLFHVFVVAEPGGVVNFMPRSLDSQATCDSVLLIVASYFSNSLCI